MGSAANFLHSLRRLLGRPSRKSFPGSANYWEHRYKGGGTSGNGSYGELAAFKAEVLNTFIAGHQIDSVIEFGCGDGNQLGLLKCPRYTGVDVSATAIETCTQKYAADSAKRFILAVPTARYPRAAMAMSLDVIYHLIEDHVFDTYMKTLFDSAERFVIIYSSNGNPMTPNASTWPPHIVHRTFTDWIDVNATDWKLAARIANRYPYSRNKKGKELGSFADFYIFQKIQ